MIRKNTKKKARSIEMVTGSLWKNILFFSIPLMCSQLLEVMFNLSDVAVVGHFADYKALGAVGSTTLLVYRISDRYGQWCQCPRRARAWCKKSQKYRRDHTDFSFSLYIDRASDRDSLFLLFRRNAPTFKYKR